VNVGSFGQDLDVFMESHADKVGITSVGPLLAYAAAIWKSHMVPPSLDEFLGAARMLYTSSGPLPRLPDAEIAVAPAAIPGEGE